MYLYVCFDIWVKVVNCVLKRKIKTVSVSNMKTKKYLPQSFFQFVCLVANAYYISRNQKSRFVILILDLQIHSGNYKLIIILT